MKFKLNQQFLLGYTMIAFTLIWSIANQFIVKIIIEKQAIETMLSIQIKIQSIIWILIYSVLIIQVIKRDPQVKSKNTLKFLIITSILSIVFLEILTRLHFFDNILNIPLVFLALVILIWLVLFIIKAKNLKSNA